MSNPFDPPQERDLPPEAVGLSDAVGDALGRAIGVGQRAGRPVGVAALLAGCAVDPPCAGWLQDSGHDLLALLDDCERRAALIPPGTDLLDAHALAVLVRAQLVLATAGRPAEPEDVLRVLAKPAWSLRFRSHLAGGSVDDLALLWWRGGLRGAPPSGPRTFARPGEAAVVVDLDDTTPGWFVRDMLVDLGASAHSAERVALWRERLGVAEAWVGDPTAAEEFAAASLRIAQDAGWPLQVRVLPPRA